MTRRPCPLVLIEWEDSVQPQMGWRLLVDIGEQKPVLVRSVGWLINDTRAVKVLAPNVGSINGEAEDVQANGVVVIPTCCVRRVVKLKEPAL